MERYADPVGRAAWLAARAAAANAEPVHEGHRDKEMPRNDGMGVAEKESRKRRIEEVSRSIEFCELTEIQQIQAENEDIDEDFQPSSPKRPTKRMDDDVSILKYKNTVYLLFMYLISAIDFSHGTNR